MNRLEKKKKTVAILDSILLRDSRHVSIDTWEDRHVLILTECVNLHENTSSTVMTDIHPLLPY